MPPTHPMPTSGSVSRLQKTAVAISSTFLIVGVAGLALDAPVALALVQLVLGLAGGWLSRGYESARTFLVAGSVVYLAAYLVLGLPRSADSAFVDGASSWVHLGFALLMAVLGVTLGRHPRPVVPTPR